ncbi:MAG: hypothetical protein ACYCSO_00555 [Cuniculiplasma sp.]
MAGESGNGGRTAKDSKNGPKENRGFTGKGERNVVKKTRIELMKELMELNSKYASRHIRIIEEENRIIAELMHLAGYLGELRLSRGDRDISEIENQFNALFDKYLKKES